MHIFHDLARPITRRPTVVTIGNFDGGHVGHQRLIQAVVRAARTTGRQSALVTFSPHPKSVTAHEPQCAISSDEEKLERMRQLGLDLVVVVAFTPEFMKVRASQFVEMLAKNLTMSELWIGGDFRFGHRREGDYDLLQEMAGQFGFTVQRVNPVTLDGQTVSSSRIRSALQAGDFELVRACLGWERDRLGL
jgi:riboflavin kinase / FMN adenylyltransferase